MTHAPWKKVLGFKFECTETTVTMSAEHTIEVHSRGEKKRCFSTPPLICSNRPNVRALNPHFAAGMFGLDFAISARRSRPFPYFGAA